MTIWGRSRRWRCTPCAGDGRRARHPSQADSLHPRRQYAGLACAGAASILCQHLLPLHQLRGRTAPPHWLVVDEAHRMLPASSEALDTSLPLSVALYMAVHPEAMRHKALAGVQAMIGVGPKANDVIGSFCRAVDMRIPALPPAGEKTKLSSGTEPQVTAPLAQRRPAAASSPET
jgi:hypothetical protein